MNRWLTTILTLIFCALVLLGFIVYGEHLDKNRLNNIKCNYSEGLIFNCDCQGIKSFVNESDCNSNLLEYKGHLIKLKEEYIFNYSVRKENYKFPDLNKLNISFENVAK